MQEQQLFEYSVVRIVPRVERGEAMNAGVILYCRSPRFLAMRYMLDPARLAAFSPLTDASEVEKYLRSMAAICAAERTSGPIGLLDIASRFRWLTATRSTIVQCSPVHPGFCVGGPETTLEMLFSEMVG